MSLQLGDLLVHKFTGKLYQVVDQDSVDTYLRQYDEQIRKPVGQTHPKNARQLADNYRKWEQTV